MGAASATRVLRVPGRLSFGCTDLSAAWPHGGTGLGATKRLILIRRGASYAVTSEYHGGEPVEYTEPGLVLGLGCRIRTRDDDALRVVFPNTEEGATSQRRIVNDPGTVQAGEWMSGRAVKLVFTPDGSTHAQAADAPDVDAPFVVFYRAIPLLREDVEKPLSRAAEWVTDVHFQGIRDAQGRIRTMGPRMDITL